MLGNLDVDASDDTWTLMMKDREIASGGRYDRLSFTVSKGQLSGIVSESVLDLLGTNSAPYPLAAFEGLVTPDQLKTMMGDSAAFETSFFQRVFNDKETFLAANTHSSSETFEEALLAHPMESAGLLLGSALIGVVAMLGVMRLFSPSVSKNTSNGSYNSVLDSSSSPTSPTPSVKRVGIELERPMRKTAHDQLTL
jgi:hypothetical protein